MIRAKKDLGQNFLIDEVALNKLIEQINPQNEDHFLEIGPGRGALTKRLSEKIKRLDAVELDKDLLLSLKLINSNKLFIHNESILNFDVDSIIKYGKIRLVGNLPYNISTEILTKWITNIDNKNFWFDHLILMFQKEVADRIIAETNTKNYGRLSILSNWKLKIEKIIDIVPQSFSPSPKVRSSLLAFVPKKKYHIFKDPKNLEHVTNIFFSQRRKMIKKPLKFLFKHFDKISEELSIDLNVRPQNLDHKTYYKICELYENQSIK